MAAFLRPQEFERITFPSLPGSFRGGLSQSQQFTSLWLEDRETKRQWSLDIVDVNEYAPNGVTLPSLIVVKMLKKSLELSATTGKEVELGPNNPTLDAEARDQGIIMTLKSFLFEDFTPEFKFPLNPVEVDPMVSLASQLRDAREEIKAAERKIASAEEEIAELKAENVKLRERRSNGFFSLSSNTQINRNQVVVWNGTVSRELSDFVTLSADNKTLTIVQPGVYQIYVRLQHYCSSGANVRLICLRKNGNSVGFASSNSLGNDECDDITEILRLNRNDVLDVYFTGIDQATGDEQQYSRFSGISLSE